MQNRAQLNQQELNVNQAPDLVTENARLNVQYDNYENVIAPSVSIQQSELSAPQVPD